MFAKTLLFAAALAGTAASTTLVSEAASAAQAETVSVAISYGDLNLASAAGRATLDGRIRNAVSRLCSVSGVVALHVKRDADRCADQFAAQAHDQVKTQLALRDARTVRLAALR